MIRDDTIGTALVFLALMLVIVLALAGANVEFNYIDCKHAHQETGR